MRPNTLRLLRRYHHYLGLFFAPWIILFSVSGALQTFRLNEAKGYGGPPPQWMVWLSAVHKDQGPPREADGQKRPKAAPDANAGDHGRADASRSAGGSSAAPAAKRPNPLPLKIFVVLLSISLILSSLMGIVIALANRASRRVSLVLLVLGTVIPAVLLWL